MADLSKLLADYVANTSKFTFFISSPKRKNIVEEQMKEVGYSVVMYPANP